MRKDEEERKEEVEEEKKKKKITNPVLVPLGRKERSFVEGSKGGSPLHFRA